MINIQKHIISEAFEQLSKSAKLDESKLTERYSFPEVDDALYHFWNDLGKDPEVDDVIGFLEDEYPDWVPTDPEDYSRWYHDVAGEISARLSESKLKEEQISEPKYRSGDVVFNGDATGYHGTFLINGDFRKIPKELYSNIRRIYKYGDSDKPYYKVEYRIDSDSLFEKDHEEFFNKIIPMLRDVGISVLESEDIKESKLTEAPMDVKDYAARLRARKAEKDQNPLEKINSQIDPDMSITDQLQVYFDELVPESGPAKTVAGELVRAIMRILYRDYNDGDLWYTGYGKETCGDSVIYLVEHIEDLQDLFDDMIYKEMEDAEYTDALEDVASRVMVYLNEHPELFTTPLDKDSRSGASLESYFDLPTYEFEPDTSYDDGYYDVSDDDIDEFLHDIVESDFGGATVRRWARDAWTIEGLDKEQLEYLEDVWERWFRDFLRDHEREEEPDDEYDDEDEVAEADWDDSTDSEFDESLKESTDKVFVVKSTSHRPFNGWIELMDKLDKNGEGEKHKFTDQKQLNDFAKTLIKQGYKNYQGYPLKESTGYKKEKVDNDRFKRSMLTQKIFYEYPDISEDDEDYLNSLSYDALVKECKNRGWEDLLKDFDESLNKDNQKRGKRMKIVAEDFQECNLNKMGTNEYEANTNRQKHINMYRKFANLNDDEVITEDMIDDLALTKTATYCNREPDRIKAEILGQRYSEYEQQ